MTRSLPARGLPEIPGPHARPARFPHAATLGAATLAIVLVVCGCQLGGGPPDASSPVPASPASTAAQPSETPTPSTPPTPPSTATASQPAGTAAGCDPADLAARIAFWEGAAGSRIATVELANRGDGACLLEELATPELVDGLDRVLIAGEAPGSVPQLAIEPGEIVMTLVSAANMCKPPPLAPVTIAFVFANGGRLVAAPESPTDATVPSCLGPGQPGTIEMHAWSR